MKARYATLTMGMGLAALLVAGCSSNMFKKGAGGAAAGAASSAFLGAVTDLIVDGSVNTYRLERNLVSGAIAGGAAGAAVGASQDRQAAAQKQAAQAAKPTPPPEPDKEAIAKVGRDNYEALVSLINYQHEDAYRKAVKGGSSKNPQHQEASYVVRALIDKDRGNADGVADALVRFLELDTSVENEAEARKGLNDLYKGLEEERKVQGVWRKR